MKGRVAIFLLGMTKHSPFWYFQTSPDIIRLAVVFYVQFPLSLRNVEDLRHACGIEISHETVRFCRNSFGPLLAAEIRRKRVQQLRAHSNWKWHLDEVLVKINGETHYLWRAENSHLPFRRRERAMLRFRRMRSLQKFVSVYASVYNHSNRCPAGYVYIPERGGTSPLFTRKFQA